MTVSATAGTNAELLETISRNQPDVTLICLLDGEHENICLIPEILKFAPQTKVVLLVNSNDLLDQKEALKLGAAGIVEMNQNPRSLMHALKQVSEGETCVTKSLLAQLLGNTMSSKPKHKRYLRNDSLTNRELEVVQMIGQGMKNKNISKQLFISEATVRHHLSSIYGKLAVEDRLNLVIYAYQNGIIRQSSQPFR